MAALERYFLRADGVTWSKAGSTEDFRDKVLPPDSSFMVESKYAAQAWRHAGSVRTNAFRKNLVRGLQSFASGFPQDLSPVQIGAVVNPGAPAATRWTGNNVFAFADQIQVLLGEPRPFEIFYLRGNGSTWRPLVGTTDVANAPILGATSLILIRRVNADGAFRIPLPLCRRAGRRESAIRCGARRAGRPWSRGAREAVPPASRRQRTAQRRL